MSKLRLVRGMTQMQRALELRMDELFGFRAINTVAEMREALRAR